MADLRETAGAVDDYLVERLHLEDEVLAAVLAQGKAANLPPIAVSAPHGALLELLVTIAGATRILEVGTLGGYSAIRLARAAGPSGRIVTLEADPAHCQVAQSCIELAGMAERVDIRLGLASETLESMVAASEAPFDLVFIDADKKSNPLYVARALELSRPGTVLFVDNVVRDGAILEADSGHDDVDGTRAMFDQLSANGRIATTAIQTVGSKGYDGFLLGVVVA